MRLSENFTAGASARFHIPGEFFCFDNVPAGSVDARFFRNGQRLGDELIGVIGGWTIAPKGGFDLVEVTSSLTQAVSFYITRGPLRPPAGGGPVTVTNFPALQPVAISDGVDTALVSAAGRLLVELPAGGGGLTDAELRATPVPVDNSEFPANAALADADGNPNTTRVGSNILLWNGATWDRAQSGADNADAVASAALGRVLAASRNYVYNGATWDRQRGSTAGVFTDERPATLNITVAGGANAIATATLLAAGAGLFHYITHLFIKRVNTAALAGGAILTVTTTNLGGRSWRTGNQASITVATHEGALLINSEFAHPIKSAAANVNTTIVGPAAGAAVSWHIQVDYFTAP